MRANALNGAWCANTLNTSRSSKGRANAPNFIIIFSSGVNPGSSWVPQRVVRPQTGARYVSEGGRGVIPTAQAVGVILRLYFIRPGRDSGFRHGGAECVAVSRPCDWGRAGQG